MGPGLPQRGGGPFFFAAPLAFILISHEQRDYDILALNHALSADTHSNVAIARKPRNSSAIPAVSFLAYGKTHPNRYHM
jgi:hypothetical protein